MITEEKLLEKIPTKTPVWSIGIVTVLVSISTCLVTIYVIAKEDISKTIVWSQNSHDMRIQADDEAHNKTINGVLEIVNSNMQTVSEINRALGIAQVAAASLAVRVQDLEQSVGRLQESLSGCEGNLKSCLDERNKRIP